MHYRHAYHAANFADVFKHVLLVGLLAGLSRKDKPWVFVDTHAGAGDYDLDDIAAGTTGEWRGGIGALADAGNAVDVPALVARYLSLVGAENADGGFRRYPGSPQLARWLMRPELADRLVLCEKVDAVADDLKRALRGANAAIHVRDGYEAHALVPPAEKRGLMLIDPPFERGDEFDAVAELLRRALARFGNGVYAVWYPLKNAHVAGKFVQRIARESGRPTLDLMIETDAPPRAPDANGIVKQPMTACGMVVVNPPFGFAEQARDALAFLAPRLAQGPNAGWAVNPIA